MIEDESTHTCACGGSCSCQDSQATQHVYLTREEYVIKLEQYLVDLKAEIESVEKELMELKSQEVLARV
jgi:hypothetical protein